MLGRIYSWRGEPQWRVIARWAGKGPRNVLIEHVVTGKRVVRPFRGLRRTAA